MKKIMLLVLIITGLFLPSMNITKQNYSINYIRVPLYSQIEYKRKTELFHNIYNASELGKIIRARREELGLSIEELTLKIGASGEDKIEDLELGRYYPDQGEISLLELALKILFVFDKDTESIPSPKEIAELIEYIGLSPEELAQKIGASGKLQVEGWMYPPFRAYPENRFLEQLKFFRDIKLKRQIQESV